MEKVELDNLDIKVLRENFDDDTINKIDMDNVSKIIVYLKKVYYQKKHVIKRVFLCIFKFGIMF